MDVTQTTASGAQPNPAQAANSQQQNVGPMISSDFETFLKMLTAQMKNQDPLNPIESTDYAVQLATFSGVEQQVQTNDLLKALQTQLGFMSMSDLAGWVGMEARATVPSYFDLNPITVLPRPEPGATEAVMVVVNESGEEVDRMEVPVTEDPITWAGMNEFGNLHPAGHYTFYLQSYTAQGMIGETQMSTYSEIVEARMIDGQTMLVLETGDEIPASQVDALRPPQNSE